jgi:hypothetical protein
MKLKGHKHLIASGATAMVQRGSFCWQPSAEMFFGFLPNTSATDVVLRGRERFTDYVERLADNISLDWHQ